MRIQYWSSHYLWFHPSSKISAIFMTYPTSAIIMWLITVLPYISDHQHPTYLSFNPKYRGGSPPGECNTLTTQLKRKCLRDYNNWYFGISTRPSDWQEQTKEAFSTLRSSRRSRLRSSCCCSLGRRYATGLKMCLTKMRSFTLAGICQFLVPTMTGFGRSLWIP